MFYALVAEGVAIWSVLVEAISTKIWVCYFGLDHQGPFMEIFIVRIGQMAQCFALIMSLSYIYETSKLLQAPYVAPRFRVALYYFASILSAGILPYCTVSRGVNDL
jgi:hypothetical protein